MSEARHRFAIGCYGVSGSGKTQTARALLKKWRRPVVFDTKQVGDFQKGREVAHVFTERHQILAYLGGGLSEGEECSFSYAPRVRTLVQELEIDHPTAEDKHRVEAAELGWLCEVVYEHIHDSVLVIDEGAGCCGAKIVHGETVDFFTRGRAHQCSVILCAQRPALVSPTLRGETYTDQVYLFQLGRRDELEDVAALPKVARDFAPKLAQLDDCHGYRITRGRVDAKVQVIPGDRPEIILSPVASPAPEA